MIEGHPPNDEDTLFKEKHLESISKQTELMEGIAKLRGTGFINPVPNVKNTFI